MKNYVTVAAVILGLSFSVPALAQAPAQAPAPPQAQAQAPADPHTWQLDAAHTQAQFSVRHMMVTNVKGNFGKVTGSVRYDGKDLSTIAADVAIDTATINTNNEKRDAHLRSPDFFDVANHPTITFKSKRVEKGAAGHFKLVGDLTIRGVTKEVVLDVEGPVGPVNAGQVTKIGATATTTINRHDYGVKWNRVIEAGGVTVGDEVKITLDIEANQRNAPAPVSQ